MLIYIILAYLLLIFHNVNGFNKYNAIKTSIKQNYYKLFTAQSKDEIKDDPIHTNSYPKNIYSNSKINNKLFIKFSLFYGLNVLPVLAKDQPPYRPIVYSVDMTNPPSLVPRTKSGEISLVNRLSKAKIITLGYHLNSNDIDLEIDIISKLLSSSSAFDFFGLIQSDITPTNDINTIGFNNKVTVGLDFISNTIQQQQLLDNYILSADKLDDANSVLKSNIQIVNSYNFDDIINLFQFARLNKLRLIPLAVPDNVIKLVSDNGFESLNENDKRLYIYDPKLFIDSVSSRGFPRYAEKVIGSEYDMRISDNTIKSDYTFDKYLANRIFTDEGIAFASSKIASTNSGTLVVLANYERVRFGYGIQERLKNIYTAMNNNTTSSDKPVDNEILSIILNPTNTDSISPTVQLNLALAYSNELPFQRPFSDFIWFSKSPLLKLLTRVKNPISREGDKPEGESSVLGVFK